MRVLLVAFLLVNALFWGLASHSQHCSFVEMFGMSRSNCPPHYVHLTMGVLFYLGAVYVQQKDYLDNL